MKKHLKEAIARIEKHRAWTEEPISAAESPYMSRKGTQLWNHDLDLIIAAAKESQS